MNALEQEARPILTALANAAPLAFDGEKQALVAQWVTLKCLVAEHDKANAAVTPLADRLIFRERRTIPPFFRIYVTLNVSGHPIGYVRHTHCIALSPEGPSPPVTDETPQNIQTFSFLFGRAFFHVNAARIENFTLESRNIIAPVWTTSRIWPPQSGTWLWPRRPALDAEGIGTVTSTLARYLEAGVARWV